MRSLKGGIRHQLGMVLALVVLTNMTALPAYSVTRKARRQAAAARGSTRRTGTVKNAPVSPSSQASVTQDGAQEEEQAQSSRIAFASDRDGDFEIYVSDLDGGGLTRLTDNPAEDISPAWSPDGTKLAFVSYRDGNPEIYVMNANGGGQTNLTNNPAPDLDPAWSPDGTKIAFTSTRGSTEDVYVMAADGSGGDPTKLTNNAEGDDSQPAWSPDGASIAFTSNRERNSEIYVMNADGSDQRNLTNTTASDSNPTWSPMRITFESDRDSGPNFPETNFEIYSINAADGTAPTRLTNSADDPTTPVSEAFDTAPARSSDGSRLAFASTRDGDFEIYVANADGSGPTKVTDNDDVNDIEPAIQPLAAAQGSVQFAAASFSVNEGAGSATVVVTRTGSTAGGVTVDFATSSGTASDRSDFTPVFRTLTFAEGDTSQSVTIPIINDGFAEPDETLDLTLSNSTVAALGSPSNATLTITDNDSVTSNANPIDGSEFFVRQHYLDFLNREPDAAGLAFWTNEIESCGADAVCRDIKRVNVSGAFFLSIEFRETGFLVYRAYAVAFGPTRVGGAVPLRLEEFLPDVQQIGQGVIVGVGDWQARLEANKRAYFEEFVARPAFTTAYPSTLTPAQFVDALNANAGGALSASERDALVAELTANNSAAGRASVLRKVSEDADLMAAQFNRAFVLMQYFGYLRRNPDDPPDTNFNGYNFWLAKLNQFGGDFRAAELVKAFIHSNEYRRRFGP
jgi:Tol biopolymer transport system component